MTEVKARLFFASSTADSAFYANVQSEDGAFWRIEMSRAQLRGFVIDAIKYLFANIAGASPRALRSEPAPYIPPHAPEGAGSPDLQGGEG